MLKKFFLTMLGGIFATSIYAKDPKFNDYPVQVFKGKNAPLKLNSNTSNFKTRFRALANLTMQATML
jgi:hypothetical protein